MSVTTSATTRSSGCSHAAGWRPSTSSASRRSTARSCSSASTSTATTRGSRSGSSRGAARRHAGPPEHRHAVRLLRARRRPVHRHGVRRRRLAALARSAASRCRRSSALVEGMLAGLGHAERHGIAHRDLKPENLLLTLARQRQDRRLRHRPRLQRPHAALTMTGIAIGTPGVHGPEQAIDETARSVHGPLRGRRDRVRAARGPPAVRRRHAGRRSSTATCTAAAAARRARPASRSPPSASGSSGC